MNRAEKPRRAGSRRGQSAVEYLVIVAALMAAFISAGPIGDEMASVMSRKYKGYSYAVAMPDPPSLELGRTITQRTNQVGAAYRTVTGIINNPPGLPQLPPAFGTGDLPGLNDFVNAPNVNSILGNLP